MYEIGGFLGLELTQGQPLHSQALALNNGRNALRLLLRASAIKRIHVPVYTCPALVPAIQAEGVAISYYRVTVNMEPMNFPSPPMDEAILLINYFGLKDATVRRYAATHENVIVDQCQALYAAPPQGLGSIYSPRKFVGVADGGYLYCGARLPTKLPMDESSSRYLHCLQRIDTGAPAAFDAYQRAETQLSDLSPALMSRLTRMVLSSIDYRRVSRCRRDNFARLHSSLSDINMLSLELDEEAVPMVYPLVADAPGLREYLIGRGVYVARYWTDPRQFLPQDPVSDMLSEQLFPLPIDQRYGASEMQLIVDLVIDYLASARRSAQSG